MFYNIASIYPIMYAIVSSGSAISSDQRGGNLGPNFLALRANLWWQGALRICLWASSSPSLEKLGLMAMPVSLQGTILLLAN